MHHGLALQWRHFKQSLRANGVRLTCWRTSCYPRGNILSQSARLCEEARVMLVAEYGTDPIVTLPSRAPSDTETVIDPAPVVRRR